MKKSKLISVLLLFTFIMVFAYSNTDDIKNNLQSQEAVEMADNSFDKMMSVIMHKRCINCHPAGNTPRQGEDSHLHHFDVERGADNHGLVGYTCNSCHTEENNTFSGVPGAPHWAIAPASMSWEGKSHTEVATLMMNPTSNGDRSQADILKHLTEDELVLWAWDPGVDAEGIEREKPPIPKEEFIQAVKDWINAGAVIPSE